MTGLFLALGDGKAFYNPCPLSERPFPLFPISYPFGLASWILDSLRFLSFIFLWLFWSDGREEEELANTFFELNATDNLLDGDLNTYTMSVSDSPFVRVQLNASTEIRRLDITLFLETGITYKVSVKQSEYTSMESETCRKFTYSDRLGSKKTVTVTCNPPLQGKWIEIVASGYQDITLKVFEFERFECSDGTYGENCSNICSDGCNKQCDKDTGDCICYRGEKCEERCPGNCLSCDQNDFECKRCVDKWYGVNCELNCSSNCGGNGSCDIKTGNCNVCLTGYFGSKCNQRCSENCDSSNICDQSTGFCQSCKADVECMECKNNLYYGKTCDLTCNTACINKTCDITGYCKEGCEDAYLDAVRSKCGIYHGMDARVINIYKMDTAFLVLVLQLLYILNIPQANTFFQLNATDNLLDGDLNTYTMSVNDSPFVRSQLNASTEIRRLDITLFQETGITYKVSVKQSEYTSMESEICRKFTYSDRLSSKKTVTVTCNPPLQGKWIEIVASGSQDITLKVFEFERFECSDGTYGENCSNICSDGCNKQCDKDTGDCICKNGRWGQFCKQTCPLFCSKNECNSNTGNCYSCTAGYYGLQCDNECSFGCQKSCNMTSGSCLCKPGYYRSNCSLKCSSNCLDGECYQERGICSACNNGSYGDFCDLKCFGDCNYDKCHKGTGICGSCVKEKGEKCEERCPDNCLFCDQNDLECKRCVDKWYGVNCELNCFSNCGGNGSCDIKTGNCNMCLTGYFGSKCNQRCSENCDSSNICDQSTGFCHSCKAGMYGPKCSEYCNSHCRNSTCSSNRPCAFGCEDGWFGSQCNYKCSVAILNCKQCDSKVTQDNVPVCRQCADRWYLSGTNCLNCPENCSFCLSDVECMECKNNLYYGKTCDLTCNTACINKTCDITGYCKEGCEDGKYGGKCDQDCVEHCIIWHNSTNSLECEAGYFGESCQMCLKKC
uniref:EGF-like domain-containing protein n=1 Tax=Magallana gigas TaxID=29159 RepID=A0A8W8MGE6_MAGGI